MNQLRSRMDETGARTALVRGASPPPRPPDTVTVTPGAVATVGLDGRRGPLLVSAETPGGRTVRRYSGRDASAAADCAAELTDQEDPEAVWLCEREQIRSWWGDGVAALLERRLGEAASEADARLVVWTAETDAGVVSSGGRGFTASDDGDATVAVETSGDDGVSATEEDGAISATGSGDAAPATEKNGAVHDRYDVVVDP